MKNEKDYFELAELTIGNVLDAQRARRGDKIFLTEVWAGRTWTYAQLDDMSQRIAAGFRNVGVSKGQHVGLMLSNSAEHIATFFALGRIGAVSVPVNTAARGDLLHYYFDYSDVEVIVVDEELAPRLADVLPRLSRVRHVVVVGADGRSADLSRLGMQVTTSDLSAIAAAQSRSANQPVDAVRCSDLLMLAFTSGTTGPSKGIMVSHAAALTYGTSAAYAHRYVESDIFYICLPLFHNNALLASMGSALICGGSVALSKRFSVSKFMGEIRASHATVTNLLGAMSSFLWSQPETRADLDHNLRLASMAPVPVFAEAFEKRFGLKAMTNYGLSDFANVTAFVAGSPTDKLGSIGKPRRDFEVRIVDDDDFECTRGQVGEIVVRSKEPWRAASGYYKMPEQTLAAHRNQWFHTGDRGLQDDEDYVWFVDRKKDCIRRRGENISAFEVEKAIMSHPAVANAAVFPVRTPEGDEEVGAAVVLREGAALDQRRLVDHCARNMTYFMVPRYIEFVQSLPVTENQKVEKFRLKQQMEADLEAVWDREKMGVVLER